MTRSFLADGHCYATYFDATEGRGHIGTYFGCLIIIATSLNKARDGIRGMYGEHEAQFSVERAHSDSLKAEVISIMGQVTKVKDLLHVYRSKECMALAEVKTLEA